MKSDPFYFLADPVTHATLIADKLSDYDDCQALVLVLNSDAEIVYLNQSGCEILGLSEEESLGLCWMTQFIPLDERNEIMMAFEQLMRGHAQAYTEYYNDIQSRDGEILSFKWKNRLILEGEQNVRGSFSVGADIRQITDFDDVKIEVSRLRG